MSLRVDELELPADGPIGSVRLLGLAACDLVVITGPNGAGKTMLVRPLEKPGPSTGRVVCVDGSGARSAFAVRGKGIEQSITFVASIDLMAKFRSLKEPLALAAHVTREAHWQALLDQVATSLKRQAPPAAEAEPSEIRFRRSAYLDADRRCGTSPRTLGEYERLGKALAARVGAEWKCPALQPQESRVAAESSVTPEFRALAGLDQVQQALRQLKGLANSGSGSSSGRGAQSAAESALRAALSAAEAELREPIGGSPDGDLLAHARTTRQKLSVAREAVQRTIEAMDRLDECRRIALDWLSDPGMDARSQDGCPVCSQPVDQAALKADLGRRSSQAAPESSQWHSRRDRITDADTNLQSACRALESAREAIRREHEECARTVRAAAPALRPASGWAPQVREAVEPLHQACMRWLADHEAKPTADALDAAQALREQATLRLGELVTAEQALNSGLEEARERFRNLQALGTVLALQAELDAIRWTVSVGEMEADRRRSEQRGRWIEVLEEISGELQQHQNTASDRVVHDEGVQGRFRRLIERIARTQPGLAKFEFRGDRLESAGSDCSDDLSEGQRVLVNIAAVIAVAGKVAGSPAHLPGWIAFDEPTNGLDDGSRDAVAGYLGAITTADLPSQIFVTTFARRFADRLAEEAARNGRRVRLVELPPFVPGQPVRLTEKEVR